VSIVPTVIIMIMAVASASHAVPNVVRVIMSVVGVLSMLVRRALRERANDERVPRPL